MTPPPAPTTHAAESPLPWAQTSFLAADPETAPDDDPSREIMDALRAADRAKDAPSQRRALDRLAKHLSRQAQQRSRTPVPKRPQ